jgi:hypothetical protein
VRSEANDCYSGRHDGVCYMKRGDEGGYKCTRAESVGRCGLRVSQ